MKKITTIAIFTVISVSGLYSSTSDNPYKIVYPPVEIAALPMTEENMIKHPRVFVEGPDNIQYSWTPTECRKTHFQIASNWIQQQRDLPKVVYSKTTIMPEAVCNIYNLAAHEERTKRATSTLAPLIRLGVLPPWCR